MHPSEGRPAPEVAPSGTADLRLTSVVGHATAHEFVRETLRQAIVRGQLGAGTRLVQADLAAQLDVSTTPVREALRDLATEGLITLDRHRGGIVRGINWQDMAEIALIHELLAVHAVAMTVERITEDELRAAESVNERMSDVDDTAAWVDLNRQFHNIFHDATRLPRLAGIMKSLQESATIFVGQAQRLVPEIRKTAGHEHRVLIDACRRGDAESALRTSLEHFKIPLTMSGHASSTLEQLPTGLKLPGANAAAKSSTDDLTHATSLVGS